MRRYEIPITGNCKWVFEGTSVPDGIEVKTTMICGTTEIPYPTEHFADESALITLLAAAESGSYELFLQMISGPFRSVQVAAA